MVLLFHEFVHWFLVNAGVLSVLVTLAIAIFLVCCLKCTDCSCRRDEDDLFKKHNL